jgi:predicted amidohydrolase
VSTVRVALANLRYPASLDDAVRRTEDAIAQAAHEQATLVCFPECYLPGYRGLGHAPPPPERESLERAWAVVGQAAARNQVAVILGTERVDNGALYASALVLDRDGAQLGFQDKVQIDPSEEGTYTPAATSERRMFEVGGVRFGVVICHEGWRYPETVRSLARQGAHVVFHPHLHEAEPGRPAPTGFADSANTFHEKAALCRAAENTCYFATVNYASPASATTSALVGPDGALLVHQPHGREGLLVVDLDPTLATGALAHRYRDAAPSGRGDRRG